MILRICVVNFAFFESANIKLLKIDIFEFIALILEIV